MAKSFSRLLAAGFIFLLIGPAGATRRVNAQTKIPEAVRKVFQAASDAMCQSPAVEFRFKSYGTGSLEKTTARLAGTARLIFEAPGHPAMVRIEAMSLDPSRPSGPATRILITSDGESTAVLSAAEKTLWRSARHRGGGLLLSRKSNMFLTTLIEARRLTDLLEYSAVLKRAVIDGTLCDLVTFPLPGGGGYSYAFGADDHLPKSMQWETMKDGSAGARIMGIASWSGIEIPPVDAFRPGALPEGYIDKEYTSGGPAIGDVAPAWTVTNGDKASLSLAELKGHVVIMDFWATWCGPCEASLPTMRALWEKYRDRGLRVVGLNWKETGDAKAHFQKKGITYPTFPGDAVASAYGVDSSGIPTVFIVGPDGRVLEYFLGFFGEETTRRLKKAIERAVSALGPNPQK